jgi:serine O-acetyltransferase
MLAALYQDLRRKARWMYGSENSKAVFKVLFASGTMAMVIYRLMQWSRRYRLFPLELIFNKLNSICCHCIIGRGAEFGPGLVLVYSNGIMINGRVRGGSNVTLYHQVTLGGEQDRVPVLGDNVLIGAGAKVVGPVRIGDGATVAVNSAVFRNVPPGTTVIGVPAEPIWLSGPQVPMPNGRAPGEDRLAPSPPESSSPSAPHRTNAANGAHQTGLESRLITCFAAAFGDLRTENIPRASVASLAEWDSLATMTLVALIEEEFQLQIPAMEITRLTSFSDILAYLIDRTVPAGKGRPVAKRPGGNRDS